MSNLQESLQKLSQNLEQAILGKAEVIRQVLVALLCEGHVLLEDVPGVGKTTLGQAIARSLNCEFARIQCTPDLLPSDVIGVNIYNQATQKFEFRTGPIHHQVVLADEVNRASPKTQSALLECMEERQATVDGISYPMPRPFLVLATQNPVDFEGTYPLPEAQLDRFFLRIRLGYPSAEAECDMLEMHATGKGLPALQPVLDAQQLAQLQKEVAAIKVEAVLRRYIVNLVRATRELPGLALGASPRGSLALFRASQAWAALEGRNYVIPDDIQAMAGGTLSHRLLGDRLSGEASEKLIRDVVAQTQVPL